MSRFERNPKKTIAALLVVFFVGAELFGHLYYRVRHKDWLWRDKPRDTLFTPYGLWENAPNCPLGMPTDVNGFVHNGYNRAIREDQDKFLIFVLGGSTVYGMGASSNASTMAAQLEKLLGPRFRVVNAGVTGYFSYQQLGLIEGRLTQEFKPGLVIALDGRNDAVYAANYEGWKPNWYPEYDRVKREVNAAMQPSILGGLAYRLPRASSIANYIEWFAVKRPLNRPMRLSRASTASAETVEKAAEAYFANHEVAHLRLARRGIPYCVFLQPTLLPSLRRAETADEKAYMAEFLKLYYAQEEIFLRPMEAFYARAAALGPRLGWFTDLSRMFNDVPDRMYVDTCHYTDAANLLLARRIAQVLREKKVLGP